MANRLMKMMDLFNHDEYNIYYRVRPLLFVSRVLYMLRVVVLNCFLS